MSYSNDIYATNSVLMQLPLFKELYEHNRDLIEQVVLLKNNIKYLESVVHKLNKKLLKSKSKSKSKHNKHHGYKYMFEQTATSDDNSSVVYVEPKPVVKQEPIDLTRPMTIDELIVNPPIKFEVDEQSETFSEMEQRVFNNDNNIIDEFEQAFHNKIKDELDYDNPELYINPSERAAMAKYNSMKKPQLEAKQSDLQSKSLEEEDAEEAEEDAEEAEEDAEEAEEEEEAEEAEEAEDAEEEEEEAEEEEEEAEEEEEEAEEEEAEEEEAEEEEGEEEEEEAEEEEGEEEEEEAEEEEAEEEEGEEEEEEAEEEEAEEEEAEEEEAEEEEAEEEEGEEEVEEIEVDENEVEETEVEEGGDDVYEITIKGKSYYVTNEVNSSIYIVDESGEEFTEVGIIQNGVKTFY